MPVFRRTKRWLIPLSGLLLSSILLASCGENQNPPSILDIHGQIAANESVLFWVILGLATLVFVLVEGALIFSIVRFRDQPGRPNPRQIHGNLTLEILWTAIPTGLLIILLFFTIRGLIQVAPENEPADPNKVTVTAIGHQWWWEFYYPQYGFTTADTLEIPTNTIVHVDLFSNNVIHSFWVPQLTGKTDVVPGHDNRKWFDATNPGTYLGICAEYCGTQHANMRFNVIATDRDSFLSWTHTQQMAAAPLASDSKMQNFFGKNGTCTQCHGIVGVNQQEYANTQKNCNSTPDQDKASDCLLGPNLTHFGSRTLIAGGVLTNNIDQCSPDDPNLLQNCHLAQWLNDPQGVKPGNDMNIGQLSKSDIKDLVAYLESLK